MKKSNSIKKIEYTVTIQDRGQLTLPSKIRAATGLKTRDRVKIEYDGNEVVIKPVKRSIKDHFGKLGKLPKGISLEMALEIEREERNKKYAQID